MSASRAYYRRLILRLLSLPLAGAVLPVSNVAASGASPDSAPSAARRGSIHTVGTGP